jgi:preprotein translocase subunit SecG
METLIVVIHSLVSILLILIVLIQGGENVDITAAFGGVSQAAFGPRGAISTLAKITWVLAGLFMATSITLAIMATKHSGGSILQDAPAKSAPQTPASAPAQK